MTRPHLLAIVLAGALSGGCGGPNARPTGLTMPSNEELLAATPGGGMCHSMDTAEIQVHGKLPAFLYGEGSQIAIGVDKPVAGARNPDDSVPCHRWGLWHYFHCPDGALPAPADRTEATQRGHFEDGKRTGKWEFWHLGGQLRAVGTFADNRMHGEWQVWQADGQPDEEHSGTYENGVRQG
ncbi:MAG: toxin-antitoxin system YwqK family antitoxin [Planctomycetota bacterium]